LAYELQIRGAPDRVKVRSPLAVTLLPYLTLGIYHCVWWYRVNRELRDFGRANGYVLGQNPTISLLALFPGGLLVVPALLTYLRGTWRVQYAERLARTKPANGWIALVLFLFTYPALWWYLQRHLNELWRLEADPLPGEALPASAADAMPRSSEPPSAEPTG
jgi:hypothetical protein